MTFFASSWTLASFTVATTMVNQKELSCTSFTRMYNDTAHRKGEFVYVCVSVRVAGAEPKDEHEDESSRSEF